MPIIIDTTRNRGQSNELSSLLFLNFLSSGFMRSSPSKKIIITSLQSPGIHPGIIGCKKKSLLYNNEEKLHCWRISRQESVVFKRTTGKVRLYIIYAMPLNILWIWNVSEQCRCWLDLYLWERRDVSILNPGYTPCGRRIILHKPKCYALAAEEQYHLHSKKWAGEKNKAINGQQNEQFEIFQELKHI